MPNALAHETSPYLLQHAGNPVDWLPWGDEALRRAHEADRPILVSIGYSACHWCHVMEHESFEDPDVASLMNERFVNVKVDREERPDVDALYMEAVQAMSGQGGWPLNVFLTPEQVPFYGGTYFPPDPRHGMPSWRQVLTAVAEAWDERREEIVAGGAGAAQRLRGGALLRPSPEPIRPAILDQAVEGLREGFDSVHGGWGRAPKFPAASTIELLLARGERAMALQTLRSMASGGIFDQVGGGFHRYSVDAMWTVPHFEKMLCDNALLARAYLHGWLASGDPVLRRVCEETLDWALREMHAPDGGFFSALDADSEGVEGRFYVWTTAELVDVLGADAAVALEWLGASHAGNMLGGPPGANVLESRGVEPEPEVRERIRRRLLAAREGRSRPATDDKRLASWNALMVSALADAGAALEREDLLDAARSTADFLLTRMRGPDGRLRRTFNAGAPRIDAFLEDHAFLLEALLTLYEATFEERWFLAARASAEELLERFADPDAGGFFSTADDAPALLARRKELEDQPIPSGGAGAAFGLLRLALLTGERRYEDAALGQLALVHSLTARHPEAFGHTLQAIDLHLGPTREVALVGEHLEPLARVVRGSLRPRLVLAGRREVPEPSAVPLLAGREPVGGRAAAYVCERFACRSPVTDSAELAALLDGPASAS
ncbi:MAG: thioredoxin domain-containing protein [Solirubrobacteraceae bacterium]|nr:thioredoxin domain-containing protein [Solirubrobacteraceae bacterium]